MAVRFYVDADTLGLAKILAALRPDVTYPGDPGGTVRRKSRPACPITDPDTDDTIWIPEVARRGWVIVTRDRGIARRRPELDAVIAYNAKLVAITSEEKLDNWHLLEIFMINWRAIDALADNPGPFVYTATRSAFRRILP